MLTTLSPDALALLGARFRAQYLTEQAGYTLAIAAREGEALAALLPKGYLDEAAAASKELDEARKEKALVADEVKTATSLQNGALRRAKVWRRRVAKRASRVVRQGGAVADGLTRVGRAQTVPSLLRQLDEAQALLEGSLTIFASLGAAADDLLAEGKQLAAELRGADSEQEIKRLKDLPDAVRAFREKKGALYTALKVIHDAGHELYAGEPARAASFNLGILYRHAGKRPAAATAEPTGDSK